VNGRAAGPTLGDGGSVLAVCGWGLRPTGSAGVSSGRVGGRSGVLGVSGRPVLATASHGARQLPRPLFVVAGVALPWWRIQGLADTCWRRRGGVLDCARSRPVEVLQRCRGAASCLGRVRAADMVRIRAKASTDAFVGGHGGGAFGRRSPHWGHHGEASCAARSSQVKTLSFFGCATAAPWRRALPGDVVVGVPSRWRFVRCYRLCSWFVLPWLCRGSTGA
jgi:hypothetical protein